MRWCCLGGWGRGLRPRIRLRTEERRWGGRSRGRGGRRSLMDDVSIVIWSAEEDGRARTYRLWSYHAQLVSVRLCGILASKAQFSALKLLIQLAQLV